MAGQSDPPPPPSLVDQALKLAEDARREIRKATRTVRSATRAAREMAVLGVAAYALGNAILDLCPWCKKGSRKVVDPPFCPTCHRNMLEWSQELQEEFELHCKSIRAGNKMERKEQEAALLRKLREEGVARKIKSNKSKNRE